LGRLIGFTMAQESSRFARIVIAVVEEENNLTADFALQPPPGPDFCQQETFRKKTARLLAETNDGSGHFSGPVIFRAFYLFGSRR
jgi:hypothetical protein